MFPGIKLVAELPDFVISSETGAYSPFLQTIWVKKRSFFHTSFTLLHELGHFLIDQCGGKEKHHMKYHFLLGYSSESGKLL